MVEKKSDREILGERERNDKYMFWERKGGQCRDFEGGSESCTPILGERESAIEFYSGRER